jgi:hypothetical protein
MGGPVRWHPRHPLGPALADRDRSGSGRGDADARLPGAAMIWKAARSRHRMTARRRLGRPCPSHASLYRLPAGPARDATTCAGGGAPAWRCGRRAVDPRCQAGGVHVKLGWAGRARAAAAACREAA